MLKTDALILLVNSLSKTEKKTFRKNRKNTDYIVLYDIIETGKNISSQELKTEFEKQRKNANFNVAVSYLYKLLLNTLLALRENHDNHYYLFLNILKVRILFEKALYEEAFDMLEHIKEESVRFENQYALLYASRLELEYLLFINLPNISETELLKKHFKVNEILKNIRKINEQSSLYELLKHRIIYKGNIRSKEQKNELNDLVISEMSIMSMSSTDSFETKKLHQLFQSSYLIDVGDSKSAIHSYYGLIELFENNKHLWANPPYYYLFALEGILDNLRSIKNYDKMPYFIEQLKNIGYYSAEFQTNVTALVFLYELFPLLDRGEFAASAALMKQYNVTVLDKMDDLSLTRQAEVSLYIALIHIGLRDFKSAHKALINIIIRGKSFYDFPLYRTIRLINLIIKYETGNDDIIIFESRSIKRELLKAGKAYRVEHLILNFLNKPTKYMLPKNREKMWEKMEPEIMDIRSDIYENQLLKYFDLTAWVESTIRKVPLQEVLAGQS